MRRMTVATLGMLLLVPVTLVAQPGHDLFQQALVKERADGDLRGAIQIYERIAREFAADRALAAKALVQVGRCHEKLGNEEAQRAYQRVVQEYADQTEMAREARGRLTALQRLAAQSAAGAAPKAVAGSGLVLRQLEVDPGFVDGSPAPDGRSFAYLDYATGDVALWDLTTGEHRRLTKEGRWVPQEQYAINVSVAPDGNSVAYTWSLGQDSIVELRVLGLADSVPRVLCRNTDGVGYPMSWSRDSRHIAVPTYNGTDSTAAIVWVSVEDGSIRHLASLPHWHWGTLSHSPDDAFIAMEYPAQADSGRLDVLLVATDGSGIAPLVKHPANDGVVGWVPNSNSVLFRSDRSGTWDLWEVKVVDGQASGDPRIVRRSVGDILPLGFSNSGSFYYALSTFDFTTRIAPFDVATGHIDVTASEPVQGSHPAAFWSPDGEHLAFISQVTPGRAEFTLEVRNVVTGEARTHAEQLRPDKPSWFPDGRSLLVPGWVRGQPETGQALYQIDVTTGSVTTLLEFPPEPSWSLIAIGGIVHADPDYLIYVHGGTLRRHHLPSGHDEVLFTDPGLALRSLALSPSGSELAFAVNDSTDAARPHPMVELYNAGQLMVVSLDSGEVRKLARITEPGIISSLEWTPDGAQVLFLQTGSERSVLWRVSREGGEAEPVWESERRVTNFSLAPDGGRATYTTIHVDNEIWVMENLRSVLER